MKKKNTDGLQQELMDSPDLTQFLSQNQEQFVNKNVAELLNHLFEKKNISKAALAKQSGMSEIYLHQIFAGRRNPSRNRLLCLCYGLYHFHSLTIIYGLCCCLEAYLFLRIALCLSLCPAGYLSLIHI